MTSDSVKPSTRAAIAAIALVLFALGCGGGGGGPTYPPPNGGTGGNTGGTGGNTGGSTSASIMVENNQFTPSSTTVPVGTTVDWMWNSCTGDGYGGQLCTNHSVVFDDGVRTGSAVQGSGSFSSKFAAAGTFNYHCSVHGAAMHGTITVQ